ncbi:hypothetical protein A2276_04115 [candidate division WOR-1 bacterium RIFOXYA12_FULL_43_27]|uniref:Pyruvate kinase barrel domain-containing protein n=1 Tax=candidate division WOR-1 bacterium RIFOXYC2_FULL_46_14 TaxID=1802587 RepID=A0A1F4U6Y2_UNCSA|nr:MAG: hypothetical protein A2276_04115 [candidate division WOR-1 bacterium RIFOXYA12_FULL_43_27]OGC19125.1 MAG: hypothetical protein A2292_00220 [candidate division WOR-1 bacterium RIFOXYB2_FULL_46_45]OGC30113.1 MAG: hypothetical protein A2232_00220 [candidate division WOR-1 bacterium RIFOXYA2_FULL_46_56]OGC40715.1 MAG: hypothetical protein A2438_00225 [candidate division WOR-1 bacterium RIFOXYC2_FULL_46_14]
MSNTAQIIATIPFYSSQRGQLAAHPFVSAIRYNTATETARGSRQTLSELQQISDGKKLWIDLKTRQLRVREYSAVPEACIRLVHPIEVNTPVEVHFRDATWRAMEVRGDRLYMEPGIRVITGRGQPINILAPSLEIKGFFTPSDLKYIRAAKSLGMHSFMLSFVERKEDIEKMLELDPEAEIIAKIESRRGLDFVRGDFAQYKGRVRLMAALDDLFTNMGRKKIDILPALQSIIAADPSAIAASRILTSLEHDEEPSFQDIATVRFLKLIGFDNFMLCDNVCRHPVAPFTALKTLQNLLEQGWV